MLELGGAVVAGGVGLIMSETNLGKKFPQYLVAAVAITSITTIAATHYCG